MIVLFVDVVQLCHAYVYQMGLVQAPVTVLVLVQVTVTVPEHGLGLALIPVRSYFSYVFRFLVHRVPIPDDCEMYSAVGNVYYFGFVSFLALCAIG